MITYRLEEDSAAIRCLLCQRVSHHPQDVAQKYCGACHIFHDHAGLLLDIFAERTRRMIQQYKETS